MQTHDISIYTRRRPAGRGSKLTRRLISPLVMIRAGLRGVTSSLGGLVVQAVMTHSTKTCISLARPARSPFVGATRARSQCDAAMQGRPTDSVSEGQFCRCLALHASNFTMPGTVQRSSCLFSRSGRCAIFEGHGLWHLFYLITFK
jgi:hypothetical protein